MANLASKDGIYLIRFRYAGIEYKRSLKTRERDAAKAALNSVELTIHRLVTGQVHLPSDVGPGDFILSGGTLVEPVRPAIIVPPKPSTKALMQEFLASQTNKIAPSYHASQKTHLGHFERFLGARAAAPCDSVLHRDLESYLQSRLAKRSANTAKLERITLIQFYKWAVRQEYLVSSPAAQLPAIKGGQDRPQFRTIAEIDAILARGGLTDTEQLDLWECLFLAPHEIARLLSVIRANAREDYGYLLHAIPAYTGMRRGEILRACWVDLDLAGGFITARSRKQSRKQQETRRRIDLHPELLRELQVWKAQRPKGQFILSHARTLEPLTTHHANHAFWQPMRGTEWCLEAKRNWYKLGFHTYRHSFASNLAAAGVDQRVIDEFMGHTTEAMRKRYRHLFPSSRRSAIQSFSFAVSKE